MNAPRFPQVRCSQCGCAFGPGESGYSSCSEHRPKPHELTFTSKVLSEGKPVLVTVTFVTDEEGLAECTSLYAGNLDLSSWLSAKDSNKVEMEARDALFAELTADAEANVETRAECRRDDARADYPVPLPRMAPTYLSSPTADQMAAVDEMAGVEA